MHIKKFFWFLILCLAVLLLFVLVVICPLVGKIKLVAERHLANQDVLAKFYQREQLLKTLRINYETSQPELLKLGDVFLNRAETVDFITDLEEIARQTNNVFEIKSANASDGSKNAGQDFLDFRINTMGNFNNFVKFLAGLEDTPRGNYRLIEIREIDISRIKESDLIKKNYLNSKTGDIESTINIRVYAK